jgi:hypothetical protein
LRRDAGKEKVKMKRKTLFNLLPILSLTLALGVTLINLPGVVGAQGPGAQDVGTAFTYQGRLNDADEPADGTYDSRFIVYDAPVGGSQVGNIVTREDVTVTDGFFAVELDPGSAVFTGDPRYLEIGVRAGDSTGGFTLLSPRQSLLPVPYAMYAQNGVPPGAIIMWSGALSSIPGGWALCDGTNGTPDLRDRFIMGVSQGEDPSAIGGSTSHYHTTISHEHTVGPIAALTDISGDHWHTSTAVEDCGVDCTQVMNDVYDGNHFHSVEIGIFNSGSAAPSTTVSAHLPPYFKLAFLMKLPY